MTRYSAPRPFEVVAVYRLLVPLPVTVDWPSGPQVLELYVSDFPPFADANLRRVPDSVGYSVGRFKSVGHAEHTFQRGFIVPIKPPHIITTFFDRLVREGRADILHWPHTELTYLNSSRERPYLTLDAFHTYNVNRDAVKQIGG